MARVLGEDLPGLTRTLNAEIAGAIEELRGDEVLCELLESSTEGNVETFLHVLRHDIAPAQVTAPFAAIAYARILAQRGISSNALLRAYRIGQNRMVDTAMAEIARSEQDRSVAFLATQMIQEAAFTCVDRVAEFAVREYESERERWLANRNTVRAEMLETILGGRRFDLASAEAALGHRLGQWHLGMVVAMAERAPVVGDLRDLETAATAIGGALGAVGRPLSLPQDRGLTWCWLPLGGGPVSLTPDTAAIVAKAAGAGVRIAMGTPEQGPGGFSATHRQALRARAVATAVPDRAVVSFAEPGVEAVAFLAADPERARELVTRALGGLATDDEHCARLRRTLEVYLATDRSYVAAAERLHLHKNTVRYRVAKAVELRGRPLGEARMELDLALNACRWLGKAVLPESSTPG